MSKTVTFIALLGLAVAVAGGACKKDEEPAAGKKAEATEERTAAATAPADEEAIKAATRKPRRKGAARDSVPKAPAKRPEARPEPPADGDAPKAAAGEQPHAEPVAKAARAPRPGVRKMDDKPAATALGPRRTAPDGGDEEADTPDDPEALDAEPQFPADAPVRLAPSRADRIRMAQQERDEKAGGPEAASPKEATPPARPAAPGPTAAKPGVHPPAATEHPGAPTATTPRRIPVGGPPMVVTGLLSMADVKTVTKTRTRLDRTTLPGIPVHAGYNNIFFRARRWEQFGVSVQVWKEANGRDARWRYDQMVASYPNVTENESVTKKSFFSYWGEVYHLVFLLEDVNATIGVSCGRKICDPEQLLELATRVRDRAKSL